jgi:hypothetical protein
MTTTSPFAGALLVTGAVLGVWLARSRRNEPSVPAVQFQSDEPVTLRFLKNPAGGAVTRNDRWTR